MPVLVLLPLDDAAVIAEVELEPLSDIDAAIIETGIVVTAIIAAIMAIKAIIGLIVLPVNSH